LLYKALFRFIILENIFELKKILFTFFKI